jgi:3-oxoacyl-[acyl-carrier-protein] synthase-1
MNDKKLYIAGMGMITALGPSVATTVAAVRAGKSAYQLSEYETEEGEPLIMARVPNRVFEHIECEFEEEGNTFNNRHERIIRMAIVALRECVQSTNTSEAVPLIFTASVINSEENGYTPFLPALVSNVKPWIDLQITRRIAAGRAGGIEAIEFAFQYLMNQPQDYLLVLGVDSSDDEPILRSYGDRILSPNASDAFAPGEGASALLLTRHIELAHMKNGCVIALNAPCIAEEEGNLCSDKPYRGEGLDKAFKGALKSQPAKSIHRIYSSMNGENHWAKEYGVAFLRNKEKFSDNCKIEHPADCYGDLGAASSTALITLAAEDLRATKLGRKNLVYCSSDKVERGAVVLEKIAVRAEHGH